MGVVISIILFALIIYWFISPPSKYDDSDDESKKIRSGMFVYTDHLTGLQYLSKPVFGSLIPRLDRDGNHICVKEKLEVE